MAPAEDPRTPEGMEGAGQSSPGPSALHGPQPSCLSSQGAQGLQRMPRMGCPAPPRTSVSPLLALPLSDPARICPQGLTMYPWSWRYWALRTAGRETARTRRKLPARGVGPRQAGRTRRCGSCSVRTQGLSDTSIIHLQHVIFSPSVMFQPTKAWPHTAGDKAAVASLCGSKNGGQRREAEADGHRQGRSPAQGRRRQAPGVKSYV